MNTQTNKPKIGYKEIQQVERDFINWVKTSENYYCLHHKFVKERLLTSKDFMWVQDFQSLQRATMWHPNMGKRDYYKNLELYYNYLKHER